MSEWFDAEAHADRALEMFERGRWAEAETELRKAISLNPDHPEWHYNLGLTLEAAGREAEALASYERVIELMPEQFDPLVAAGALCIRLRRFDRAVEWLDQAIALSPGPEPKAEQGYAHKIDALVRMGDHAEAETTYYIAQQMLEDPSAMCLAAIAESLIERKSWDRAGWCLREALRLEPNMGRLRLRLALVLSETGKPQRALQMYLRDLRDDPGNIDTLLDYGELLVDMGRLVEGAEKFRRVLELEPANVDAHFRLGQVAMTCGRCEQAHLEFELVKKLDPKFPTIRLALAEALLRRGQDDEALRVLREQVDALGQTKNDGASASDPDELFLTEDHEQLGNLLLEAGDPAAAVHSFRTVIDERGEGAAIGRKLAIACFRSGALDAGTVASRRVLRHDPKCVPAIHNLALAALQAGKLPVAAGWIARGLRVDRRDEGLRRLRMQLWIAWIRRAFGGGRR